MGSAKRQESLVLGSTYRKELKRSRHYIVFYERYDGRASLFLNGPRNRKEVEAMPMPTKPAGFILQMLGIMLLVGGAPCWLLVIHLSSGLPYCEGSQALSFYLFCYGRKGF